MDATARRVRAPLAALIGFAGLASAMGIGRFAFTPLFPLMQQEAGLSIADGAWLASANYAGYLAGAVGVIIARNPVHSALCLVAPLFGMVQGIDDTITLPGGGGLRALFEWRDSAEALRKGSFDIAVLLPNSFASALIAKHAGIPERWGFATDWRGRLLTKAIAKPTGVLHQYEYYQALTAGLGMTSGPPFAAVWPDPDRTKALIIDIGLDPDEPFVVFAPGAAYGHAKRWIPEYAADVAARLARSRGMQAALVGAADELSHIEGSYSSVGSGCGSAARFLASSDRGAA